VRRIGVWWCGRRRDELILVLILSLIREGEGDVAGAADAEVAWCKRGGWLGVGGGSA
jgi:hypothetical protein